MICMRGRPNPSPRSQARTQSSRMGIWDSKTSPSRLKAPLRLQDSQSHFPRETILKPLVHFWSGSFPYIEDESIKLKGAFQCDAKHMQGAFQMSLCLRLHLSGCYGFWRCLWARGKLGVKKEYVDLDVNHRVVSAIQLCEAKQISSQLQRNQTFTFYVFLYV